MKKFFLMLITLSILPFSMLRSIDPTWTQIIVAGTAAGIVLGGGAYYYRQSTSTPAEFTQTTNPQDPADGKDSNKNGSHKKDSTPVSKNDNNVDLQKAIEELDLINQRTKETTSKLSIQWEKPEYSSGKNTLKQPTSSKPSETIAHKDPSFMEKLLDYSADYKALHDENRDCFEN